MPVQTLCCPYCNSCVNVQADNTDPLICPRCGETMPLQSADLQQVRARNGFVAPAEMSRARPRANRQTGLLLLGGMFVLAGIGFAYMLLTHDFRRSHDPVAGQTTALAYLPKDTDVAALAHIQQLRSQPAGKELLTLVGLDADSDGPDLAEHSLGVKLKDLDVLLLAFKTDAIGFRPVLLVQTRKPYDADKVRAVLDTGPPIHDGYRTVYQVRSSKVGLRGVWFAAANVFALGGTVEDLEAVPQQPHSEALPSSLGGLAIDADTAPLWLAGHSGQWPTELASWLWAFPHSSIATVSNVRSFALWFDFHKEIAARGKVDCADSKSAKALADLLSKIRQPDINLTRSQSDIQVDIQARTDMATIRRAIGRLVTPAARAIK